MTVAVPRVLYNRIVRSVFARQVSTTMTGQALTLLLLLAANALTARWLGPAGKGQYSLAMLIPEMLGLFMSFGISSANVYFAGFKRVPIAALSANAVAFSIIGALFGGVLLLVLVATSWISHIVPGVAVHLVLLAMLLLPLSLLGANFSSLLLGLRRIGTLSTLRVFQAVLIIPLLAIFVKWLDLGVSGAITASITANICFVTATGVYVSREGGVFVPRLYRPVVKSTLGFGLKGYVGNLLQFFNYRLDSFLVNGFIGSAAVGIYSTAIVLAELLWQLPNSVGYVIFPKAASSDSKEMNRFTPRVFWAVLVASSLGAIVLALGGKTIIRAVFSERFLDAYMPMVILLPGVVLLGAAKVLTNEMAGRGYPHYNSTVAGVALVVTITLDLILIPTMGVIGAAIASTVAYSLTFVLSYLFYTFVRRRSMIDAAQLS